MGSGSHGREMAAGALTETDVYPAIAYLVRRLGDGHSGFFPPAVSNAVRTGGAENPIPDVRIVDGNIGYIRIDGYSGIELDDGIPGVGLDAELQ